jgi:hypothetical protein
MKSRAIQGGVEREDDGGNFPAIQQIESGYFRAENANKFSKGDERG